MASPVPRPPNHHTKTIRKKKTRDLPNLSDCHACKRHTNTTNPTERLRILTSHWRIVLLCKSCIGLVLSSNLCSYCLSDQPGPVHNCRKCLRKIHTSCASRYSRFAPFSYLPNADFEVCIDCWMPKSVDSRRRDEFGADSCSPGVSRVSDCQDKAMAPPAPSIAEAAPSYDKRLALQLHRAMNSSPRIAKGLLLASNCCAKTSKAVEVDDDGNVSMKDDLNAVESERVMETVSVRLGDVGCEGNSVNGESESCDEDVVVVCGGMEDGRRSPECDRFIRKYRRRAA